MSKSYGATCSELTNECEISKGLSCRGTVGSKTCL